MSPTDAAYLAGLLDGEGSVMLYRRREAVALRIAIANTHRGVLQWVADVTGVGSVCNQYPAGPSVLDGREFIRKASYGWHCNADAAESVLLQIRQFMQIKSAQADLGIATHAALRDPASKSDRTWQQKNLLAMKAMNGRGGAVT